MQGDIIYVDYERSSWKYMDDEKIFSENDVNPCKIGGNSHIGCDTREPCLWEVQPKAAEALMWEEQVHERYYHCRQYEL